MKMPATMCRLLSLVSVCFLSAVTAADTVSDEQRGEVGHPHEDVCHLVGSSFCGSRTCVSELNGETFSCDCGEDHFYNVPEGTCAHVQSCTPSRCQFGECEDGNHTAPAACNCTNTPDLTPSCEVSEEKKEECNRLAAIPSVGKHSRVKCICRPSEVFKNDRCLPTTCLNFTNTCEKLCHNNQLDEDHRCCQGWKHGNCTVPQPGHDYCKPGYLKPTDHDNCTDACSAGETNPICPVGCTTNTTDGSPYNCVCSEGQELAHDGLRCVPKTGCNAEEKAKCREDQVCALEGHVAMCKCPTDRVEVNGHCSDNCTRECHHKFARCTIFNNQEHCQCSSPLQSDSPGGPTHEGSCVLEKYSYVTSLRLNTSLPSWEMSAECHDMKGTLMNAFRALFGVDFLQLDIINCRETYEVRLIFNKKQDQAVLRRLHLCKGSMKPHTCYFWPDVHVVSGSVGAVEPENICDTVLRQQVERYEAAYVCHVQDDEIHFNCVNPAAVTGTEKSGRIIKQRCSEANKASSKNSRKGKKDEDQTPPSQTAVIVGVILAILAALGIVAILMVSRKRKAAKADVRRRQEKYEADLQQ